MTPTSSVLTFRGRKPRHSLLLERHVAAKPLLRADRHCPASTVGTVYPLGFGFLHSHSSSRSDGFTGTIRERPRHVIHGDDSIHA